MTTPHYAAAGSPDGSDPRLGRTWPLPGDATCAGVARSLTGAVLASAGLPAERVHEAEVMVCELATNAHEHARGHPPHELWLYPVHAGELICAVFDARPGLLPDSGHERRRRPGTEDRDRDPDRDPDRDRDGARSDRGRGLVLVDGLSGGRWGAHLTRSRLGGAVPGKVVWFGVPLPPAAAPGVVGPAAAGAAAGTGPPPPGVPAATAQALRELLVHRGVGPVYVSHRDGLCVVSIPYGLTVWIRDGRFELPGCPATVTEPLTELPVVLEHLVRRYEQHRLADR